MIVLKIVRWEVLKVLGRQIILEPIRSQYSIKVDTTQEFIAHWRA